MMLVLIIVIISVDLREAVGCALHCLKDCFAGELIPRCCDDMCIRIQFTDDINISLQFFSIDILCSGKNHTGSRGNLIIEEFLEVAVVDLGSGRINDSAVAVKFESFDCLDGKKDIGQFAYTGGFNDDVIRVETLHNLFQGFFEGTLQGAADASAVDLSDFNACFFQETAVNADFTEFVFYEDNFLTLEYILDQFLYQSSFACSEKAGDYIYFSHLLLPSFCENII